MLHTAFAISRKFRILGWFIENIYSANIKAIKILISFRNFH